MSLSLQVSPTDTVYFADSSFVIPSNINTITLIAQGGGGGGGGVRNGFNSGAGGFGAAGYARVIFN